MPYSLRALANCARGSLMHSKQRWPATRCLAKFSGMVVQAFKIVLRTEYPQDPATPPPHPPPTHPSPSTSSRGSLVRSPKPLKSVVITQFLCIDYGVHEFYIYKPSRAEGGVSRKLEKLTMQYSTIQLYCLCVEKFAFLAV